MIRRMVSFFLSLSLSLSRSLSRSICLSLSLSISLSVHPGKFAHGQVGCLQGMRCCQMKLRAVGHLVRCVKRVSFLLCFVIASILPQVK